MRRLQKSDIENWDTSKGSYRITDIRLNTPFTLKMVRNTNQITEHKNARNYEFSKKTQIATDNASVGLPSESVRKMNNSGVFLTCFIINRIKLNKWSLIGFIFLAITIHFSHFEMEWLCHHADCIHYLVFVPLYSFPSHSQLLLMLSWYSFSRSELNLWWWKL